MFNFFKKTKKEVLNNQAVLINLDGKNLSDEIYKDYDLSTLEDRLIEIIEKNKLGEYDGNEFSEEGAIIYIYSSDAENLFTSIKPILQNYPLCKNAKIVIRKGVPGASQREEIIN